MRLPPDLGVDLSLFSLREERRGVLLASFKAGTLGEALGVFRNERLSLGVVGLGVPGSSKMLSPKAAGVPFS